MTVKQARALKPGDAVWWTDPDGDLSSRWLSIEHVQILGDFVEIVEPDGSCLQALPRELHHKEPGCAEV